MNRTDRLLAIILELQAKRWQRAEDLATTFEVSKRTIYRDMQALAESGVPLVAESGQGYSLVEGYFLPPLSFSVDEATTLLLGADYVRQNFDAQYRSAAQSAQSKIDVVLSDKLRAAVDDLRAGLRFVANDPSNRADLTDYLPKVRRAIIERKTLAFDYYARNAENSAAQTSRLADPYALVHAGGNWFVVAYCHLRHDIRHFHLSRIDNLRVTLHTFERPANFRLEDQSDTRSVIVKAVFRDAVIRWAREQRSFYMVSEESHPDGWLVTMRVRHENDVFQWLLSWGANVCVLEPTSLNERLADEARRMVEQYHSEKAQSG